MPKYNIKTIGYKNENGIVLITVLLFLLLISGISLWGAKKSILSERIARNQVDYEVARQAAESALRDAERDIFYPSSTVTQNASCARGFDELSPNEFTSDCDQGLCFLGESDYKSFNWSTQTPSEVWWPLDHGGKWNNSSTNKPQRSPITTSNCVFKGATPYGTYTGALPLSGVAKQPEYIIEYFKRKNVQLNLAESQVTSQGRQANQWSHMYRITARGFGYSTQSQVVLQTIFFP